MLRNNFYLTTTLPYVNAPPHIGFALEITRADILARYHRLLGDEVFFNTGTDEHGLKIYRAAQKEGKNLQKYVDEYAAKFDRLKKALNLSYDNFIRTTDPHHASAAQEFWKRCEENGDIEKKIYKVKYCVGCELEKTDSELVDGRCPIHPELKIEIIEEENYFFKFSKYQRPLLELYKNRLDFVVPETRLHEIKKFVERGLEDFSISRLKEKMPWGVPVPGGEGHVMYVWFDALVGYISVLGWPKNKKKFEEFWGTKDNPNAIQIAGKDNLRQQSAMWQAMLFSAGLPSSRQIYIEGFITSEGQKISKSSGNVIDPFELVEKYGTDAVRYYLARHIHPFEDSDFTEEKFREAYNADLSNGLGNFAARVLALWVKQEKDTIPTPQPKISRQAAMIREEYFKKIEEFRFNEALQAIWDFIAFGDRYISENKPWENRDTRVITDMVWSLKQISHSLKVFLPQTAERIETSINQKITGEQLFPRLD